MSNKITKAALKEEVWTPELLEAIHNDPVIAEFMEKKVQAMEISNVVIRMDSLGEITTGYSKETMKFIKECDLATELRVREIIRAHYGTSDNFVK